MSRDLGRLVEPPRSPSRSMQWNRYHNVGAGKDRGAMPDEQCRQWTRQRFASVVLERVDDCPQRARVLADRAAPCQLMRVAPASWTLAAIRADAPPRRHGIAAHVAERRSERVDPLPAGLTDRSSRRFVERPFTRGAEGGEENSQEGVDGGAREHSNHNRQSQSAITVGNHNRQSQSAITISNHNQQSAIQISNRQSSKSAIINRHSSI